MHLFDPADATDVRGISVLSSAIRKHAQKEVLDEATLQTAILQTIFAAVLTSDNPSKDAFDALEAIEDEELREEFIGFLKAKMDKARESNIGINGTPTVAHLGPGEDLQFRSSATPGKEYLPFASSLDRETARAIGVTYSSYAMDHSDATYSSVRMENATIWPIAVRRRERLAAPMLQAVYESWFDEMVGEGRIKLKVSYEVLPPTGRSSPGHNGRDRQHPPPMTTRANVRFRNAFRMALRRSPSNAVKRNRPVRAI